MKKTLFIIFILIPALIFGFFLLNKPQPNNSSNNSPKPQAFSYSKNTWLGSYAVQHPEYKTMPIKAMSEYSVSFQRADGKTETDITGGPMNYKDENGNWKPIDPTLKQVGSFFTGEGIKTKIGTDGAVVVNGQNFSQKTTRFGYFNPTTQTFTPLETFGQGQIEDNIFTQKGTWYKNQITAFDNGLKEELILDRKPSEPSVIPGLTRDPEQILDSRVRGNDNVYLMFETEVSGIDVPDGWVEGPLTAGKLHFPLPTAFDANKKEADTKRYAKKIGGNQYIYTGVPVFWLASAAYPVTIDPDYSATTADGYVRGFSDTAYATARSTSDSYDVSNELRVGQFYNSNPWWFVWRNFLKFDIAAIPDTDTVSQVNLKMVIMTDGSATDFDVEIVKQNWASQDPLSTGNNKEAAYDNTLSGTLDQVWRNTSGASVNTQYTSPNLDTTWIDPTTAYAYYSLRSSRDFANTEPTGNEYVYLRSQEDATSGYRPVLTVVHAAAPTDTPTPTPTPATHPVSLNRGVNIRRGTTIQRN